MKIEQVKSHYIATTKQGVVEAHYYITYRAWVFDVKIGSFTQEQLAVIANEIERVFA